LRGIQEDALPDIASVNGTRLDLVAHPAPARAQIELGAVTWAALATGTGIARAYISSGVGGEVRTGARLRDERSTPELELEGGRSHRGHASVFSMHGCAGLTSANAASAQGEGACRDLRPLAGVEPTRLRPAFQATSPACIVHADDSTWCRLIPVGIFKKCWGQEDTLCRLPSPTHCVKAKEHEGDGGVRA
jgi:hypothetical protein